MNTQHTAGKWVLFRGGIEIQSETNNHEIYAYIGEHPVQIATVLARMDSEHDDPVRHYHMSKSEGLANAQHIVACINACKGINPESVPVMLANLIAISEIQRADGKDWETLVYLAKDMARAAIALAKGAA